jgi:hypothetical protein
MCMFVDSVKMLLECQMRAMCVCRMVGLHALLVHLQGSFTCDYCHNGTIFDTSYQK